MNLASLPKVYVITLNWNRAAETTSCMASLLRLDYPNFELVLCDNASEAECVESLRGWIHANVASDPKRPAMREYDNAAACAGGLRGAAARITLIHTGGNLGFAGGLNPGVRYALARADASYVWLLNNDTEVSPDALTHLVARAEEDRSIGICGSTLLEFGDRNRIQAWGGACYSPVTARSRAIGAFGDVRRNAADAPAVEAAMSYVIGASMLVSKRLLEVVGLMDERYFLYSEEHDWAHRARQCGFRLGFAPASCVFHRHGATIGTASNGGSPLSVFYLYRAKMIFVRQHMLWCLPSAAATIVWEATKFAIKRRFAVAAAVLRGLTAGLAVKLGPLGAK
jgi:GT2 family glycosyltransferase